MISFDEAYQRMMSAAVELGSEPVPLRSASGRVLACDVVADCDMPPFDKSAVDGYACRASDKAGLLRVVDVVHAGMMPRLVPIGPGECVKTMTGAPVPAGADCVVMREHVRDEAGGVRVTENSAGANICLAGEDIRKGDIVLIKGTLIGAQQVATLAVAGCAQPVVALRPRVGIIATGSELVGAEEPITGGRIRNSNSPQLMAQAAAAGAVPTDYGIVADNTAEIAAAIRRAKAENNLVVVSGGVSVGDLDLVPETLKECGFTFLVEKVAMKPGRPMLFGTAESGRYCCGLPGNPVSAFVAFELLLKPFIQRLMGQKSAQPAIQARLGVTMRRKKKDRRDAIPVKFTSPGTVEPVEFHGSADISSLCDADALLFFDVGKDELLEGTMADVRPIWP